MLMNTGCTLLWCWKANVPTYWPTTNQPIHPIISINKQTSRSRNICRFAVKNVTDNIVFLYSIFWTSWRKKGGKGKVKAFSTSRLPALPSFVIHLSILLLLLLARTRGPIQWSHSRERLRISCIRQPCHPYHRYCYQKKGKTNHRVTYRCLGKHVRQKGSNSEVGPDWAALESFV